MRCDSRSTRLTSQIDAPEPLRVLFVHSPADFYGASQSLLRLCRDLRLIHYDIAIVLPAEGVLAERLREVGAEVFVLPGIVRVERHNFANVSAKLRFAYNIAMDCAAQYRILRRWRPDVVHTNVSLVPAAAIAAMLCRRPHLWHLRESFDEFRTLWPLYRRFMTAFAARIVCNSLVTAAQFDGARAAGRVRVVYNGLNPTEFCDFPPAAIAEWRRRFSPDHGPVIGVVGRIKLVRKGQEILLAAAERLAKAFPAARFVCIGGPYAGNESHVEELRERARTAGLQDRFLVTGDVADVGPAIAALDIVVMPSVTPEPFGNVVMEAMCLGKPVVASANGGAREQVEHGTTGILFPAGDAAALAAALASLLADPVLARAMGEAGRKRFSTLFSSERNCAAIRYIYRELGLEPPAIHLVGQSLRRRMSLPADGST